MYCLLPSKETIPFTWPSFEMVLNMSVSCISCCNHLVNCAIIIMHNFIHATNISHHKFHSSYAVLCKFGSKHNLNDLPLNSWNIMKHRAKPPQQSPERHHLKSCSHWLTSGKMEVSKFLETQNQDLHKLYSSLFPQFIQLVFVVADAPTKIKKKARGWR